MAVEQLVPVSYTHLDVYKRQLQLSVHSLVGNSMDSLFHGQTVVAANLDLGLHGDLNGQRCV